MYDEKKELDEAIAAGERALESLKKALKNMKDADGWGLMDLTGGGAFSNAMKYSRMQKSNQYATEAKYELAAFRKELGEVRNLQDLNVNIDGFLMYQDLTDNGFAEIFVQGKIQKSKKQLKKAVKELEDILDALRAAR